MDKLRTTPGDFFLQLGIIVTLYASAISLVNLLFQIVDKSFPDRLSMSYVNPQSVLWATAVLIIMFPLYLLLGWIYNSQLEKTPEKRQLGIRRWLVFLTLFLAGLALAIDLVTLVYYLLSGDITTRFILKVLVLLVVAGMIFGYYLMDIRRKGEISKNTKIKYAAAAAFIVLVSIGASFAIFGSPVSQRKMRFDERRENDLASIQSQVINYWQLKEKLPQSLNELNDSTSYFYVPTDPETNEPYEYKTAGVLSFSLCATFGLPRQDTYNQYESYARPMMGKDTWDHEIGRTCFDRTIDPKLYPPQSVPQRLLKD